MYSFMIVCPHCGAVGKASCEKMDTPVEAGWNPSAFQLSKEFSRRVSGSGALETVCQGCRKVVEFHGAATWLKSAEHRN